MAMEDKTFDVRLIVTEVTDEDFFLGSDTPLVEVAQGVVARFSVLLTGTWPGEINVTAENLPVDAEVTFDPEGPYVVGATAWMVVETDLMDAGDYTLTMRASAVV